MTQRKTFKISYPAPTRLDQNEDLKWFFSSEIKDYQGKSKVTQKAKAKF